MSPSNAARSVITCRARMGNVHLLCKLTTQFRNSYRARTMNPRNTITEQMRVGFIISRSCRHGPTMNIVLEHQKSTKELIGWPARVLLHSAHCSRVCGAHLLTADTFPHV
eukprot:COSAG01_NODE_2991_length_6744_cov_251.630248_2_plen_110_part_00